jgi:hypothetical protein
MQTTKEKSETNELSGEPRNTYLNRLILMTS